MKNKFKILPLIIMVISLLVLPLCSHADFGDFAGESDYGAHIDINHSAVCEYCDSVLTTDTFDWVVTNIKGLSQRTR